MSICEEGDLAAIVKQLCTSDHEIEFMSKMTRIRRMLPSRDSVIDAVEDLRTVLFPGYFGNSELDPDNIYFHMGSVLDHVGRTLQEQIRRGVCFACGKYGIDCPDCPTKADRITGDFMKKIPVIQKLLALDVQAAYEGDPAATSPDEAIFSYPGVRAITDYRLAHELFKMHVPLIPRMITEHAHSVTGIDIHPGASIGEKFFIDHGTGVVIGETCII
jgi:serine O-acetyltransferase